MAEGPDEKIARAVTLDLLKRQADAQEKIAAELGTLNRFMQQVAMALNKMPGR